MNKVCLRFLFGGQMFFNAIMERGQAQKIIRAFRDRQLPDSIGDEEGNWSIRTASIHCLHLEELAPGLPVPGAAWGRSGN